MFLLPYIEATSVHDSLVGKGLYRKADESPGPVKSGASTIGYDDAGKAIRRAMAIPAYACPSSRASGERYHLINSDQAGACADYAVLTAKDNRTSNYERYYCYYDGNTDQRNQSTFVGPFKLPALVMSSGNTGTVGNGLNISSWTFDKDFSWWQDGTSNQFCLAEKFIPSWAYSRPVFATNSIPGFGGGSGSNPYGLAWDGGYHAMYSAWYSGGINARIVSQSSNLFGRSPNDPNRSLASKAIVPIGGEPGGQGITRRDGGEEQLGSCHSGVVNFLIGDGAVRSISITTLPKLVTELTIVNDGNPAAIP